MGVFISLGMSILSLHFTDFLQDLFIFFVDQF